MIFSKNKYSIYNPLSEGRPLRILILEDSELDVELLKIALRTKEFDFTERVVSNSTDFKKMLNEFNPDVILSDYALPQFNGMEALRLVKSNKTTCPFIIVTGAIDEETAVACIKAGADDYLLKDRLTRLPSAIIHSIEQHKVAAERIQTQLELEESEKRLHELFNRVESVRDEEKKRISLEIHDQLGQELTAAKLGLFWLKQNILLRNEGNIALCQDLIIKIDELILLSGSTIQSIRRIAHQLRPVILDDLGLIPAIEWMVKKFNDSTDISCTFNHLLARVNFNKEFSSAFYRIVQETLTNIMRHSKAKTCQIELLIKDDVIKLLVVDDGIGFNPNEQKKNGKLGLFGIMERLKPFSGNIKVESEIEKGTQIKIWIPNKGIVI